MEAHVDSAPVSEAGCGSPVVEVPRDHLCVGCGYPSGRSGSRICPECGWEATGAELEAVSRRRAEVSAWREEGLQRAASRWAAVILAYASAAGLVAGEARAFVIALLILPAAVLLSWWMGDWCVCRSHPERRRYLNMVWGRRLWMLHLPWLVAPVFVVAAAFVGAIDLWAQDVNGAAYQLTVTMGFFMWAMGCVVPFFAWWGVRLKAVNAGGFRLARADGLAFVLGAVVAGGAAVIGFAAGVTAAFGVAEWLGIEWLYG